MESGQNIITSGHSLHPAIYFPFFFDKNQPSIKTSFDGAGEGGSNSQGLGSPSLGEVASAS